MTDPIDYFISVSVWPVYNFLIPANPSFLITSKIIDADPWVGLC